MDRLKQYRMKSNDGSQDIHDLVAAIVAQARHEWQMPSKEEFRSVCWGDDLLGFEACMFRFECYPVKGHRNSGQGQRYENCLWRRNQLKRELIRFFNSDWFEFLCGGVEPSYVRKVLGVMEL